MYIYTIQQTLLNTNTTNYPQKELGVREWNALERYDLGEMVALYRYNGITYNSLYLSLKDNNVGIAPPILGDSWTYYDKVSIHRPLQIEPSKHLQGLDTFTYGINTKDCTHILMLGAFGKDIKIDELDTNGNILATSTQNLDPNYHQYLFELTNQTGNQNIRITISANNTDEYAGFTLIKGVVEHDLGNSLCNGCYKKRVYVEKPTQYIGGVKVYGSGRNIVENNTNITFDSSKKDELMAIFDNLIDTPIFIVKSKATQSDINEGIYGFYDFYNLREDCTTGAYIAEGTIKSYPYIPPLALKNEIKTPTIYTCDGDPTNIATKSPAVYISPFRYESSVPLIHHSTDWELVDGGGTTVDSGTFKTGLFKLKYAWRENTAGTYTVRARTRSSNGKLSAWATKTINISASNCAGLCRDPFNDGSLKFLLHIDKGNISESDVINGGSWSKNNVLITGASDGCNTTHYSATNALMSVDNKTTIIPRFDASYYSQITISVFGYVPTVSNYKFPLVLRWGSVILAIAPLGTGDAYAGGVIWLESNSHRGDGSSPLNLNHDFQYAFRHWVVTADLIKRTVKFYEDGNLIKEFYNVDDTGTSNNFLDAYDMGVSNKNGLRGAFRELAVFDRELTQDEIEYIQRALIN